MPEALAEKSAAHEQPEVPEPDWLDRFLTLINPGDRRIVTVTVLLLGLGIGSLTMWMAIGTRADAAVVTIVHREQQPLAQGLEENTRRDAERQVEVDKHLKDLDDASKEFRESAKAQAVGLGEANGKLDTLIRLQTSRR
jgi:hypothetical protein